ncbi:MAG TPA: aromatic ring-hydroxylating dioxygenase subunit alpha [Candidatus Sulfotelmatobacter sp.]|nr:aromatic ring-hydroxylating dioxygenase subunit alpha [Candidatus Sulfotelmatobacter sp.]
MPTPNTPMSATTLPARYYVDPEFFRQELERFYCQDWICAGRINQIPQPGDYFLREIAGESIIITRDKDDLLLAFFNVCRHRGTRICARSEGHFPGRIQCGYHGWTYGLDGCLIGAPHVHDGFCREDYPLNRVHADVWDGYIFINLSPKPDPLFHQLEDLPQKFRPWQMAELKTHRRIEYVVKANWKLIMLNYNECLHCPILHPALSAITDYLSGDNDPPHRGYIGGSMEFQGDAKTMSKDGKLRREYLPGLNTEERSKVYYYAILPNLLLSLHPDYVMTHTMWPRAVDRTEVICEWHFHPDEMLKSNFEADDAVEFWDITNREDWAISELSQAGIQSRAYQPGPYSRCESLPQAFDQIVLNREKKTK